MVDLLGVIAYQRGHEDMDHGKYSNVLGVLMQTEDLEGTYVSFLEKAVDLADDRGMNNAEAEVAQSIRETLNVRNDPNVEAKAILYNRNTGKHTPPTPLDEVILATANDYMFDVTDFKTGDASYSGTAIEVYLQEKHVGGMDD